MCKDKAISDGNGEKKRRVPNAVVFTPMTAKQAQEASVRARNLRKQVRAQMLDTLVNNMDFGNEMLKALKTGDNDRIELIESALRIVGLTHNQSEDAVQRVDAKLDAKTNGKVEVVVSGLDG